MITSRIICWVLLKNKNEFVDWFCEKHIAEAVCKKLQEEIPDIKYYIEMCEEG